MVSIVRTGEVMTGQYCEAWQSYNYYDSHQPWQPWGGQAWPGDLESYFTNTTTVQQLMVNVENKSPVQEVPCLPSPLTESESGYSSYSSHASGDTYEEQQQYPGQVSPPSSPDLLLPDTKPALPPINLKNNTSFTEAELKAITPWRNALIEKLLANQARGHTPSVPPSQQETLSTMPTMPAMTAAPNQNMFLQERPGQPPAARQMMSSVRAHGRPRQGRTSRTGGAQAGLALFHDISQTMEFDFGEGPDYHGTVRRGSTAFTAISGCILQANQGTGTVRAVVETVLKFCLPRSLSQYSLTGKSLQEKLEIRNGQAQSRVIMSESGSTKLCIPPQLITGLANFLKVSLTPEGLAASGCSSLSSYTRKLISKSCSRSQEKRNLEMKKK